MQNDFITGALGTPEAQAILPAVQGRIRLARSRGETVVFTRDTHGENYLSTQEGENLPVPHCIRGTRGWEFDPAVSDLVGDPRCRVMEKGTFGCAGLMDVLRQCDEVELCGVATNICVIANAVIARTANPEARVYVRRDCVASYDRDLGDKALDVMASLQVEIL